MSLLTVFDVRESRYFDRLQNCLTGREYDFKNSCAIGWSKTARKAAMYAIDLAKQLKASVIALSVIDARSFVAQTVSASETARHTIEPIEDYLREAAEGYAGEIKKQCDKSGVSSKISIKMGHPAEEIVKEAKRSKANLIVMGSQGRSALSATVLGSVSYGVIHIDTSIPILIVRG